MARGWTDNDPAKGVPHRRVHEKLHLLLAGDIKASWLQEMLITMAEKRPVEVLEAVSDVLAKHEDGE
jgi:hypothetical protein